MYTSECVCLWCTHTHVHTHTPRYISHFSLLTSQTPPPASQPASPPAHWSVREPRGERLPTDRPSSRCCHVPEGDRTQAGSMLYPSSFPKEQQRLGLPRSLSPSPCLTAADTACLPQDPSPLDSSLPPSRHPPRAPLLIHSESVPRRSSSPCQPAIPIALGPCPETPKHALEQRSPKVTGSS